MTKQSRPYYVYTCYSLLSQRRSSPPATRYISSYRSLSHRRPPQRIQHLVRTCIVLQPFLCLVHHVPLVSIIMPSLHPPVDAHHLSQSVHCFFSIQHLGDVRQHFTPRQGASSLYSIGTNNNNKDCCYAAQHFYLSTVY